MYDVYSAAFGGSQDHGRRNTVSKSGKLLQDADATTVVSLRNGVEEKEIDGIVMGHERHQLRRRLSAHATESQQGRNVEDPVDDFTPRVVRQERRIAHNVVV